MHKKVVYFYRDYKQFQGGHLKVWNYFNHLKTTQKYESHIFFSNSSVFDNNNPWTHTQRLNTWDLSKTHALFLAGLDWNAVLENPVYLEKKKIIPVINLIQGLSHANPLDIKYSFLKERAVRICVSQQVSEAIQKTGQVNGPIFTIPNAIDIDVLPLNGNGQDYEIDLLIVGIKKPILGSAIEQAFQKKLKTIVHINQLVPRSFFLELVSKAKVVVFLPHFEEGFYLPALECMAAGGLVVCPDCIGNRSFCIDNQTCLVPAYEEKAIIKTIYKALDLCSEDRLNLIKHARLKASEYTLDRERRTFLDIVENLCYHWFA